MATVDYDPNVYRRAYFARHPEKRLQYRVSEAVSLLLRLLGPDGAKALIDERCFAVEQRDEQRETEQRSEQRKAAIHPAKARDEAREMPPIAGADAMEMGC